MLSLVYGLDKIIFWKLVFFNISRDLLNYARMMPVYLRQMTSLEQDDPASWQALKKVHL